MAIILNVACPEEKRQYYRFSKTVADKLKPEWPKISFFGIYDGHGGSGCADFLRQHLHYNILNSSHFPHDPEMSILEGCVKTENDFLAANVDLVEYDKSGSCAVLALSIDRQIYIGNVGDS